MQDRVGNKVPSQQEIDKLLREIDAITAKVEAYTVALTTEQRAATTKMRTGGESLAATIGHLATEHGLALPSISVEAMNADFLLAERLKPLAEAARALASRIDDTVLEAQSEGWWAATAFYTSLARISGTLPALQSALKPVVDFFAVGRRKPKATPTAPATG